VRPERKLVEVLKITTPEQRWEALSWFVYNLLGSTLPIWLGGYILLPIFAKHFDWVEYSSHGELALYCAAFLAPTLRLIGKDVDDSVFVRRQMFLLLGWIFLTAAVALYSGVISASGIISASEVHPKLVAMNTRLLFGVSGFLFVFSVFFSALVRLIDYQRIQPRQIFSALQAPERSLDEAFDRTPSYNNAASTEGIPDTITQQPAPGGSQALATTAHPDETSESDSTDHEGVDDGIR
jgi:hypothetical protein